jgi:hypothetical protein
MKLRHLIGILALLALAEPAAAESLRCSGGSVAEGDSRVALVYKCGQPLLADSFCAPVYYPGGVFVVPEPFASAAVPCQVIEQWLYERGPGELKATVFLRNGVVQTITYSGSPR